MRIPIRCCEDAQLYFTVNCCVSAAGAFGNPAATVRQASIFVGGLSPTEENNSNQLTGEHISLNRHGFKLASAKRTSRATARANIHWTQSNSCCRAIWRHNGSCSSCAKSRWNLSILGSKIMIQRLSDCNLFLTRRLLLRSWPHASGS